MSNNSNNNTTTSNNLGARELLNNISNTSGFKNANDLTWLMNIIPLLLICAFALSFSVMAHRYTFCNITNNICGIPIVDIAPKKPKDKDTFADESNNNNKTNDDSVTLNIKCPETPDSEPKPPVTEPYIATGILWFLFILSVIGVLIVYVGTKDDSQTIATIIAAAISVTLLGLAIDASVNQDVGRSVTAIMSMVVAIAVLVAIINAVDDEGSRSISAIAMIVAITLIGIMIDNRELMKEGHVGYALTRSITMLLFVLNVIYIILLTILIIMAIVSLGLGKGLATEYSSILLLICMIAQVAVFASFLRKCLQKKYECRPSLKLSDDGIYLPDDISDKNTATRMGDFIATCHPSGIESLNVKAATISISVIAVVVFLLNSPKAFVAITNMSSFGGKAGAVITLLVCVLLLILSFLR